jgi:hypothetical protein
MGGNRQSHYEVPVAALASLAFAIFFGHSIIGRLSTEGLSGDWDHFLQLRWVPFYTLSYFHQFPFWNPYRCGGMPMFAHPQSTLLTPFTLLDLVFGPVVGVHVQIIAAIAIAFGGAYFLARVLGISRTGAAACAITFAGSSWFYLHMFAGHINCCAYTFAPWAVACLYLSSERERLNYAVLGALATALTITGGGTYASPQIGFVLALLAAMIALQKRSFFPFFALAVIGLFSIGLAAVKVVPSLQFVGIYVRPIKPDEACPLGLLVRALFDHQQNPLPSPPGQGWDFYEFGAYIGIILASLALLGMVFRPRRALPWIITGLVLLALAAGNFGRYSPWVVEHKVPVFASHRVPSRWLILFTMAVGVLAGLGTDVVRSRLRFLGTVIVISLLAIALIDDWQVSTFYLFHVFDKPQDASPVSTTFHQTTGKGHRMLVAARANTGVIHCYDPLRIQRYAVGSDRPNYRGEQYLLGPGSVTLEQWTPNTLSFEVETESPTVMVVNQNYHPGWRLAKGDGEVFSNDGLIAVRLPAARQHLELAYRSPAFGVGLAISLLSLVAMFLVWRYRLR